METEMYLDALESLDDGARRSSGKRPRRPLSG
jgi:hypothetical protein